MSMPIEGCLVFGRSLFVNQKDTSRIEFRPRGNEKHSLATLGHERERIHDTICPSITTFFEGLYDHAERLAAVKVKHE
jgi:hypothetical protein